MALNTLDLSPARQQQLALPRIVVPLVIAALLLLLPMLVTDLSEWTAAWLTVICMVTLTVLGFRQSQEAGENPWMSPAFINFLYVFSLQYGVGLLFIQYADLFVDYMDWDPLGLIDLRAGVPRSSWLIIVGALGTYAGLMISVSKITCRLPGLRWLEDARRFPFRALLLFPLIFAAYAYSVSDLALGEIQQTAYLIGTFGFVLLVCGIMRILEGTPHPLIWRTLIAVAVLGYIAVGFVFGARGPWMMMVIFFAWGTLVVRRRISMRSLAVLGIGGLLFIVIVFPWLSFYKYFRSSGATPIPQAIEWATEDYQKEFGELKAVGLIEFLRSMTYQATYVSSYQATTPEPHPYLWGESAWVILSTVIPRFINPDKANVLEYVQRLAYQAGLYTDATYFELETRGAISIDPVSEFYINFGPWGVLVLSVLQGIYLRLRYEWLILRSELRFGFPIYAVGFVSASSLWQMFVLDIKNWFIWTILLWLLSRRS